MSTSTINLRNEYDVLKASITSLQTELENKNQLIYDCKKQLAVATALEGDFLQEIETLQVTNNIRVVQLKAKIKEVEENIITLKHTFNPELSRKAELVESLQNEVMELSKNTNKDDHKKRQSDRIKVQAERNFKLNEEVNRLRIASQELETHVEGLQTQNVELEKNKNILLVELENTGQNLTCKTQELTETKNLINRLQEEIFLIKLDIESLKNKPLDAAKKGNSLFGEVEDSRVKIQQSIQQMKKKYAEMKRDVCNKFKQMTALRAENIKLNRELDSVKTCDEKYEKLIEEYNIKIHTLKSAIEKLQKEILKEQTFTGKDLPSYVVEFTNNTLRTIWSNEEKSRQILNTESKKKLKTVLDIKDANTEMQKWRRKAQQLKVNIEQMENTFIEMQLQNSPDSTPDGVEQKPTANFLSDYQKTPSNAEVGNSLEQLTVKEEKKSITENECVSEHHDKQKSLMAEELKIQDVFVSNYRKDKSNLVAENILGQLAVTEENSLLESECTTECHTKQKSLVTKEQKILEKFESDCQKNKSNAVVKNSLQQLTAEKKKNSITEYEGITEHYSKQKSLVLDELNEFILNYQESVSNVTVENSLQQLIVNEEGKNITDGECATKNNQHKSLVLENEPRSDLVKCRSFDVPCVGSKVQEHSFVNMAETELEVETENILNRIRECSKNSSTTHNHEQSKTLLLENISGTTILNDTELNITNKSNLSETKFDCTSESIASCMEHQNDSVEIIILDDTAEGNKLYSNSHDSDSELEVSCLEPHTSNIEDQDEQTESSVLENKCAIQTKKSSLANVGAESGIINLIDSPCDVSHNTNRFNTVNRTPDQKQKEAVDKPCNKSYSYDCMVQSLEFNSEAPQGENSEGISENENCSPIKELIKSSSSSCIVEFEESANEKLQANVFNAGHTPAKNHNFSKESRGEFVRSSNKKIFHCYENSAIPTPAALQRFRKEINREFSEGSYDTNSEELSRKTLKPYANYTGYSPGPNQKCSAKEAWERCNSKSFPASGKKTNIPVPTRRNLN